jgi:cytoskeletal protein CcmA (bactofilin family)
MTTVGKAIVIRGEISASEDLVIEGHVEGQVWADGMTVTVAEPGSINGEIVGKDVTILGSVDGSLVASEVADLRASARVLGRIVAGRIILETGGQFNGTVEPQHLEATLTVARYRHRAIGESSAAAPARPQPSKQSV